MRPDILFRECANTDKPTLLHLLKLNTPKYFAPEEEHDLIHYLDH